MKKAITSILLVLQIFVIGCDAQTKLRPSSSPLPTTSTLMTLQPSTQHTASPRINSPTICPTPTVNVDPLSDFLSSEPCQGQKISEYTVADDDYVYYQMDGSKAINNKCIYQMDKITGESRKLFNTKLAIIDQMFLDKAGCLYYLGRSQNKEYEYSDPTLFKYSNGKPEKITSEITDIIYVDENYVFYKYTYYIKDQEFTFVMKYELNQGKFDKVNIPNNGQLSRATGYQEKPFALINYMGDPETSYLYDLHKGKISPPFKEYSEANDTRYLYVYSINEGSLYAYSIANGRLTSEFPEPQFSGYVNMKLVGNEFQYLNVTDICYYSIENDETIHKQPFPFLQDSWLSIHNTDEKWYLLLQNPLKWEEANGDRWPIEVQLELYSFDCDSHKLERLWSLDSFHNDGQHISIDVESGYVWLFVDYCNYFMKLSLDEIES